MAKEQSMRIQQISRILVYKRTHDGDPDENGCFGICDCMGALRDWEYHAVIGVGGIGPEPRKNRIAGKINWIGIGPRKIRQRGRGWLGWRGSLVTFDHFRDFGIGGRKFRSMAPTLAKRMYSRNVRVVIVDSSERAWAEVMRIVRLAKDAESSKGHGTQRRHSCKPMHIAAKKVGHC
jgi:hypothetical protein